MNKFDIIKQYMPLALLTVVVVLVIVLGVVSAAYAQSSSVFGMRGVNEDGQVIAGPDAGKTVKEPDIFQPLSPHLPGRFVEEDDMRPTRIGRAGLLPRNTVRSPQQPQPPINLEDMPSLSDNRNSANNRLGPDMTKARRAGDVARMAQAEPDPIPDFEELMLNNQSVRTAQVQVHLKQGQDDDETLLSWRMNPVEYPVFIKKVHALKPALTGSVPVTPSGTAYARTSVRLVDNEGQTYAPVNIYQNRVFVPGKEAPHEDNNLDLQTWVFGTAKRLDQREIISELIRVYSYDQCKTLGHTLVDTSPRQCILPDGSTYIDIDERLTPEGRKITTFEKCLKGGFPIVDTFPRQCVAPGGRIYVEPPQL